MLTELDDTLWHQLPTTFDHVGTSDPRFFDRYWFAAYAPDGSAALQFTLGVYRNMNVVDAGCVIIIGGKQHNLRASRTLGTMNAPACGPLGIDVVKPLQSFRLLLNDLEGGVQGEIKWTAIAPPEEDEPHFHRANGRVVEDYQRFNQIGSASGLIEVDGVELIIEDWWACRDHSWGVRPRMGVPEPKTGETRNLDKRGFTMAFLFFSTEALAGSLLLSQHEGESAYTSGVVTERKSGAAHRVRSIVLRPLLYDNTRRFSEAALTIESENGRRLELICRKNGPAIAMQGLGYSGGYLDNKGLGVWRGELTIERDIWDVSDPATIVYPDGSTNEHWHRIQPVTVDGTFNGDDRQGHGSMTLILSGNIPSLGLK